MAGAALGASLQLWSPWSLPFRHALSREFSLQYYNHALIYTHAKCLKMFKVESYHVHLIYYNMLWKTILFNLALKRKPNISSDSQLENQQPDPNQEEIFLWRAHWKIILYTSSKEKAFHGWVWSYKVSDVSMTESNPYIKCHSTLLANKYK